MGKKESNKGEGGGGAPVKEPAGGKGHPSVFLNRVFDITKLVLGICLLPFVYSGTVSFLGEFSAVDAGLQRIFWYGIIAFLIVYLFIGEPVVVYAKGQKVLELIFMFFKPLVKVAPYLLPIYAILLFACYWVLSNFIKDLTAGFIFLFGFSMALHLVFSAKTMRSKQGDLLKSNYIFGFSFIYIINLILVAFCLNLIFEKYSFVAFLNNAYQIAEGIFCAVFKQLFIVKG